MCKGRDISGEDISRSSRLRLFIAAGEYKFPLAAPKDGHFAANFKQRWSISFSFSLSVVRCIRKRKTGGDEERERALIYMRAAFERRAEQEREDDVIISALARRRAPVQHHGKVASFKF